MKTLLATLACAVALALGPGAAGAQEQPPPPEHAVHDDAGSGAPGWLLPVGLAVVVTACAYALGLTRSGHDG